MVTRTHPLSYFRKEKVTMNLNSKTKNMQYLRTSNRSAIIKHLVISGSASRVELSNNLGLTKMAISSIVSDLIAEGYVSEKGYLENKVQNSSGRKANALEVPKKRINAIGVLIRRHEVYCISMDIHGSIHSQFHEKLPENANNDYLIDLIFKLIDEILKQNSELKYYGIGIASVGPVDINDRKILEPPKMREIRNLNIGDLLEERYQMPVFLDNDMNACAFAENLYGAGKFMKDIAYIGFSNGVGSGIIADGTILHGFEGFAAEIGHVSIAMDGPLCYCGRQGCAEVYTSILYLLQNTGVDSVESLLEILNRPVVPRYISESYTIFLKGVETVLTNIANIFDPEVIIIGDMALPFILPHLEDLEKRMNRLKFIQGFKDISVVSSHFKEKTPIVGSGAIVFKKIFTGQIDLSDKKQ